MYIYIHTHTNVYIPFWLETSHLKMCRHTCVAVSVSASITSKYSFILCCPLFLSAAATWKARSQMLVSLKIHWNFIL